MRKNIKAAIVKIVGKGFSGVRFQKIWEKVNALSMLGMNIGQGSGYDSSGEEYVVRFMRRQIARGGENRKEYPVLFDVGANIGDYTKMLYKYIPNAKIYCFEPAAGTYKTLCNNVHMRNCVLNNIGMGSSCSERVLYYDNDNSGLASLYKRQLDHYGVELSKSESVQIDTIDHYCYEKDIQYIDFLKMDIEGNEFEALKGAKGMLASDAIGAVQIEFGGCNIDSRTYFRDFWNLMNEKYYVYRVLRRGLYRIYKYDEHMECFLCSNYLFVNKKMLGSCK